MYAPTHASSPRRLNAYPRALPPHSLELSSARSLYTRGTEIRSAHVRAHDDRALCWDEGIPYKRAYALSSYALTCVALKREGTMVRSEAPSPRNVRLLAVARVRSETAGVSWTYRQRYVGMHVCRYAGMQVCRYVCMWVCGYAAMQVCRYVGAWVWLSTVAGSGFLKPTRPGVRSPFRPKRPSKATQ